MPRPLSTLAAGCNTSKYNDPRRLLIVWGRFIAGIGMPVSSTIGRMSDGITTRRRFQFGLGAMFLVVTLFAVWLGWELKFIRERHRAMMDMSIKGRGFSFVKPTDALPKAVLLPPDFELPTIPRWRRWLGDEAIAAVATPVWAPSHEEIEELRSLFPEADFYRHDKFWSSEHWFQKALMRRSAFSLGE